MKDALCRGAPVRRQLEAYKKSWKHDNDQVKECWECEDTIAVGLACYYLLKKVTTTWRNHVYRGIETFHKTMNEQFIFLHQLWLDVTQTILSSVSELEQDYKVEGADKLRDAVSKVRQIVADWKAPTLSKAVGLRVMELSEDAAQKLDQILSNSKSTPEQSDGSMKKMTQEQFLALRKQKKQT